MSSDGHLEAQAAILRKILDEFDEEYRGSKVTCPEELPGLFTAMMLVRSQLDRVADRLLEQNKPERNLL